MDRIFLSVTTSDQLCSPQSLLASAYRGYFLGGGFEAKKSPPSNAKVKYV